MLLLPTHAVPCCRMCVYWPPVVLVMPHGTIIEIIVGRILDISIGIIIDRIMDIIIDIYH